MPEQIISVAMIEAKARAAFERGEPLRSCILPRESAAWKTYQEHYAKLEAAAACAKATERETA